MCNHHLEEVGARGSACGCVAALGIDFESAAVLGGEAVARPLVLSRRRTGGRLEREKGRKGPEGREGRGGGRVATPLTRRGTLRFSSPFFVFCPIFFSSLPAARASFGLIWLILAVVAGGRLLIQISRWTLRRVRRARRVAI